MQRQLELYRLHNSSLNLHGQIIRARVIDMDRKKILIDTGLKIAKIAHSDITDECIIGTTNPEDDGEPRRPGAPCAVCRAFWCSPASGCCSEGQCAGRLLRLEAAPHALQRLRAPYVLTAAIPAPAALLQARCA